MALVDYLEDLTDTNFAASVDATGTNVETGEFDYELETEDGLHVAADYFNVEKACTPPCARLQHLWCPCPVEAARQINSYVISLDCVNLDGMASENVLLSQTI